MKATMKSKSCIVFIICFFITSSCSLVPISLLSTSVVLMVQATHDVGKDIPLSPLSSSEVSLSLPLPLSAVSVMNRKRRRQSVFQKRYEYTQKDTTAATVTSKSSKSTKKPKTKKTNQPHPNSPKKKKNKNYKKTNSPPSTSTGTDTSKSKTMKSTKSSKPQKITKSPKKEKKNKKAPSTSTDLKTSTFDPITFSHYQMEHNYTNVIEHAFIGRKSISNNRREKEDTRITPRFSTAENEHVHSSSKNGYFRPNALAHTTNTTTTTDDDDDDDIEDDTTTNNNDNNIFADVITNEDVIFTKQSLKQFDHTYNETCPANHQLLIISIVTDSFPLETSWKVQNLTSNDNIVLTSTPMDRNFELYTSSFCLPTDSCYMFIIQDEYGDGFQAAGFYTLSWMGEDITPSTPFTSYQQQVIFGGDDDDDDGSRISNDSFDCHNLYTIPPSPSPAPLTYQPTTTPEPCYFDNQVRVVVSVVTDEYPTETSWTIRNMYDNVNLESGETYTESHYLYTESTCLWKNQCYIFTIYDAFGDGLINTEDGGYYSVTFDGVELANPSSPSSWTNQQNLYLGQDGACDEYTSWPTQSPTITSYPTFYESTNPPTSPLGPCQEGYSRLYIILHTDQFPEETSWILKKTTDNGDSEVVLKSQPYSFSEFTYSESHCIPKLDCYIFIIQDSYGDGLSMYSPDNISTGYYLQWNDERIQTGYQNWEYEQETFFGSEENQCEFCGPGKKLFQLELQTDGYGGETYWDLKKMSKQGNKFDYFLWNGYDVGSFYKDNNFYIEKYCVPQNACYKFIMSDAFGDGLCCSNGEGQYKITYAGKIIRESNFTVPVEKFPKYNEYSRKFGKCWD